MTTLKEHFEAMCLANLPAGKPIPPSVLDLLQIAFYTGASASMQIEDDARRPVLTELTAWYRSKGATLAEYP